MIQYRHGQFYLHTKGRAPEELPVGYVFDVVYPAMNTPTGVRCNWHKTRFKVAMVEWRGDMQRMYISQDSRDLTPDEIAQYQRLLDSVGDETIVTFEEVGL